MSVSDSKSSKKVCLPETEMCDLPLPDSVIDDILMRLPLADAARTSILSTKWRYKWRQLPQLIFDYSFAPGVENHSYIERESRLLMFVYQVLLHRQAPILKFLLRCFREGDSNIDSIIHFHLLSEVEDFSLFFTAYYQRYKLPSRFFSFLQLKHLCLHYCELKPPKTFQGFSKLVTLELHGVKFEANAIQNVISGSPQLELLRLLKCSGSPSLEISGLNLFRIEIVNGFESLSLKHVPKLVDLSIKSDEQTIIDAVEDFCCSISSVEKLDMNVYPKGFAAHNILDKLPTSLNFLKHLCLGELRLERVDDMSCAIWLIRESPSIKFLNIEFECECRYYGSSTYVLKLLKQEHSQNCSPNHLRKVQIQNAFNGNSLMQFIEVLLAKSPNLHNLTITPVDNLHVDDKLDMVTSMLGFRRASPMAEIKLLR